MRLNSIYRLFAAALLLTAATAPSPFTFTDGAKVWVDGTSTLHDWTVTSADMKSQVWIRDAASSKVPVIDSVSVVIPSLSLKSGKSGMDKKMYEALKTDAHKDIRFRSNSVVPDGKGGYTVSGKLTLAGETRDIAFPVKAALVENQWVFTGSVKFAMTTYKMTPPVALMGSIKTGDDVTIRFETGVSIPGGNRASSL
jgi:polyisoprenoid-binding protein YceI